MRPKEPAVKEAARSRKSPPGFQVKGLITDAVNALDDPFARPRLAAMGEQLGKFPAPYKYQGYLDRAPYGIDARYAWTVLGGDGAKTKLVLVQSGWFPDHQDLKDQNVTTLFGTNRYAKTQVPEHARHGTQMLGIVCGVDNDVGIVGIAPKVGSVGMSSPYFPLPNELGGLELGGLGRYPGWAKAIEGAATQMTPGDVLLLPLQISGAKKTTGGDTYAEHLPVEADEDCFKAISDAVHNGIIVIEAAGNGVSIDNDVPADAPTNNQIGKPTGINLDTYDYAYATFKDIVRNDSGAILVGASFAKEPHDRADEDYLDELVETLGWHGGSNYGSRVNCYAWGQKVVTTSSVFGEGYLPPDTPIEKRYQLSGATSAASAIVAGAALCLQGIAKKKGTTLWPEDMRQLLSNPATGTRQGEVVPGKIGVMPDLRKIIDAFLSAPKPPGSVVVR